MSKILIIEDDPLIQRLYGREFTLKGFEVHVAANGQLGVELSKTLLPDCILLDIMMPQKNGFEVLDELKTQDRTKYIPIIVFTNLMSEHDAETALKKGAAKFIVKDEHEPAEVVAMVHELLQPKN